jgi:hypothetical protein
VELTIGLIDSIQAFVVIEVDSVRMHRSPYDPPASPLPSSPAHGHHSLECLATNLSILGEQRQLAGVGPVDHFVT